MSEQLHEFLWSYRTTPYSTIKEMPLTMVYDVDVMLIVEIDTPTWRSANFIEEENET